MHDDQIRFHFRKYAHPYGKGGYGQIKLGDKIVTWSQEVQNSTIWFFELFARWTYHSNCRSVP
jgi:hypothetical protein